MTALTKVRGHPLLEALGVDADGWLRVNKKDVEVMAYCYRERYEGERDYLKMASIGRMMLDLGVINGASKEERQRMEYGLALYRERNDLEKTARLVALMRELDIPVTLTDQEAKRLRNRLEEARKKRHAYNTADAHHLLKCAGIAETVTSQDMNRVRWWAESMIFHERGWNIAVMYTLMRGVGGKVDVTEEDKRLFKVELEALRKKGDTEKTLSMYDMMHEINAFEGFEPDDLKAIKGLLNKAREDYEGYTIARIHNTMRRLTPRIEGLQKSAMPPLKEFKG